MQRTIPLLLFAAPLLANAQHGRPIPWPSERDGYRLPPHSIQQGTPKGSSFYSESFDNDLNGWQVVTATGQVHWKWTNTGPGPTSSIYAVPVLNTSTPSGWAIIDDDHDGVSGSATDASLVSPTIDLSAAPPNLKLEFEQYFQEFQQDACFIGVSTDGGITWQETEVNAGVGRDGRPNPELVDVNISPMVTGNPATVRIRFRYTSVWDYGWQVDNIRITELEDNDMAIVQAHLTDYSYDAAGATSNIEYSMIPTDHVAPMTMNAVLRNRGFLQQTGALLNVNIAGPGGSSFSASSSTATFAPLETDTAYVQAYTPNGGTGQYDVTFSVDQDQEDDVPANNTVALSFQVTDGIYASDDDVMDGYIMPTGDNDGAHIEVGNVFHMVANDVAHGIQVALHENTTVGSLIYGVIYEEHITEPTTHPVPVEFSLDHVVTEDDLNGIGGSHFITIPFHLPVQLQAGRSYMVVAGSNGGDDDAAFGTSGSSAALASNVYYPSGSAGTSNLVFYTTSTPMVRLQLSDAVGIDDAIGANGTSLGQNQPNPANTMTTITYALNAPASVLLEVHDVSGKLVLQLPQGMRASGQHRMDVDTSALEEGIYLYSLQLEGARITKRMSVVH